MKGKEHTIPNPKSFALVRDSDLSILSPHVGSRYKVIQNHDAFTVFDEFVKAGQMTMETAGSFGNGQHIWGLAKTGHGFDLANGERIESYFPANTKNEELCRQLLSDNPKTQP